MDGGLKLRNKEAFNVSDEVWTGPNNQICKRILESLPQGS